LPREKPGATNHDCPRQRGLDGRLESRRRGRCRPAIGERRTDQLPNRQAGESLGRGRICGERIGPVLGADHGSPVSGGRGGWHGGGQTVDLDRPERSDTPASGARPAGRTEGPGARRLQHRPRHSPVRQGRPRQPARGAGVSGEFLGLALVLGLRTPGSSPAAHGNPDAVSPSTRFFLCLQESRPAARHGLFLPARDQHGLGQPRAQPDAATRAGDFFGGSSPPFPTRKAAYIRCSATFRRTAALPRRTGSLGWSTRTTSRRTRTSSRCGKPDSV